MASKAHSPVPNEELGKSGGTARLKIFRGDAEGGKEVDYEIPLVEGMVVLDAVLSIQAEQAPDLAVRWNCKAAHCGSCSAEINGRPALPCKSRGAELQGGIQRGPPRACPRGPGEPQGGPLRLVQRGDQRQARPSLQVPRGRVRGGDPRRPPAGLPRHKGPRLRRLVELRGLQGHKALPERRAGALHDVRGGRRAPLRAQEMHRVLYVPGRLPRAAPAPQAPTARAG